MTADAALIDTQPSTVSTTQAVIYYLRRSTDNAPLTLISVRITYLSA